MRACKALKYFMNLEPVTQENEVNKSNEIVVEIIDDMESNMHQGKSRVHQRTQLLALVWISHH